MTTDPARVYSEILRSITDTTLYRVARVMIDHQGEDSAISKEDIAAALGYEYTSGMKRRLEVSIDKLLDKDFPIMATSAVVGYFIPLTDKEWDDWEGEHLKRWRSEASKLGRIRRCRARFAAGDVPRVPEVARQRELWG